MSTGSDALLVIDMQRAFFEDPALSAHRERLIASVNALTLAAREAGIPVFMITTVHSRDRSTWTLTMRDDDQGFAFDGEDKTRLIDGLDTDEVTRIEKTRDSAWFATDLHLRLGALGIERIVLTGVSTHSCVAQTARDGFAHNFRVVIAEDAVADADAALHEVALRQLVDDRQAMTTAADEIISAWASRSR